MEDSYCRSTEPLRMKWQRWVDQISIGLWRKLSGCWECQPFCSKQTLWNSGFHSMNFQVVLLHVNPSLRWLNRCESKITRRFICSNENYYIFEKSVELFFCTISFFFLSKSENANYLCACGIFPITKWWLSHFYTPECPRDHVEDPKEYLFVKMRQLILALKWLNNTKRKFATKKLVLP